MTQVKDKTDQQLNRALAELMGWTDFKEDGHGGMWATAPDFRWTNKMPDYCTDPAASLEVQAKAIEVDSVGYVRNLEIAKWEKIMAPLARKEVSVLLTASPRERAEAAYITLSISKEDLNGTVGYR
ncbi:hypothetical protein [Paenibacillus odorifer]|uniref:hypothetical protein n=1 Tax=Paenibacillus odorifer TaxID=189426 RepID=UPI00096C762C|nr:hypothetical protein [Paenibacillus odorifer]OMD76888.1 hypothetical protein BSK50_14145 [Paenibacillus odorifer]